MRLQRAVVKEGGVGVSVEEGGSSKKGGGGVGMEGCTATQPQGALDDVTGDAPSSMAAEASPVVGLCLAAVGRGGTALFSHQRFLLAAGFLVPLGNGFRAKNLNLVICYGGYLGLVPPMH
ncbi:hypothetical protein B0H17DRAFT_1144028 [Mycena rosella]|uniref:Uncharacterized protein n=1 Tax=Mycena rosella TaxID=1033263 RepID=A0AAD7G7J9_MYCRO|nr:hypothetical protein B0H17DRAFT_1144028 [Mycena rosella]